MASQLKNNGHILLKDSYMCYHAKILRHSAGVMVRALEMSACLTLKPLQEEWWEVLGFHLSLLEVLHTLKGAAAEEAGGSVVREVSQCPVPQKAPLR